MAEKRETRIKPAGEVGPVDVVVITQRTLWRVLSVKPYEGSLAGPLLGAVVAETDRGLIMLEGPTEVLA